MRAMTPFVGWSKERGHYYDPDGPFVRREDYEKLKKTLTEAITVVEKGGYIDGASFCLVCDGSEIGTISHRPGCKLVEWKNDLRRADPLREALALA
jgi:hypothetical protein